MKKEKIKVGISGRFGFGLELANGQTIKTKVITEKLRELYGEDQVLTSDTYGKFYKTPRFLADLTSFAWKCRNIIILPAHKGIRIFAPYLAVLKHIFNFKLHYVVIGGWLPGLIGKNKLLKNSLKKFDFIYVETRSMETEMLEYGFENIVYMPNFKDIRLFTEENLKLQFSEPYPLAIFSRINQKKGIEDAVKAVESVNHRAGRAVYSLDLYGTVEQEYAQRFQEMREAFPDYVQYKGVADGSRSSEILNPYFALLFPTRYYTEGIPGTIIDAYAAGVPVVASAWKNCSDIVKDGETGRVYPFEDTARLESILEEIASDPEQWTALRGACVKEAEKFTSSRILPVLTGRLQ